MDQNEVMNELTAGICEVIYTDSYSVEHNIAATLSKNHLPNVDDENNSTEKVIHLWNVRDEVWMHIPITDIITIDRLTGLRTNAHIDEDNCTDDIDGGLFNMFEQQLLCGIDTAGKCNMGSGDEQQSR